MQSIRGGSVANQSQYERKKFNENNAKHFKPKNIKKESGVAELSEKIDSVTSKPETVIIDVQNSSVKSEVVEQESTSIAERIKTGVKRRQSKKINLKEDISSDEENDPFEADEDEEDEDFEYEEESPKRRCLSLTKRLKSYSSDSSCSTKRGKDCGETFDSYRERRDKNNEASRRSRQNRKNREKHLFESLDEEERRNVKLRAESDVLEKQVTSLRQLLLQVVIKKGEAT